MSNGIKNFASAPIRDSTRGIERRWARSWTFMKGHDMRELRIGKGILERSVCNLGGGKWGVLAGPNRIMVHVFRAELSRYGLGDLRVTQ